MGRRTRKQGDDAIDVEATPTEDVADAASPADAPPVAASGSLAAPAAGASPVAASASPAGPGAATGAPAGDGLHDPYAVAGELVRLRAQLREALSQADAAREASRKASEERDKAVRVADEARKNLEATRTKLGEATAAMHELQEENMLLRNRLNLAASAAAGSVLLNVVQFLTRKK